MNLTKTFKKKSCTELMLCSFLLMSILTYYYVDIFHILPYIYRPLSVWYLTHILPLTFVVFNLVTNFIALIYADSSVIGRIIILSSRHISKDNSIITYCDVCQCTMPQRCWHCDTCDICVLTRDHHCAFSATCVGHYNRRYFLWFLLYLSAASFYEIILICYYILYCEATVQFSDLTVLVPIEAIINGFHLTEGQIFIVLLALNIVAMTMSTLLLIYHLNKVRKGLVCHEKQDGNYDFGLMQNLETVFGEKWYITWISPFIESKLPYDGFDWRSSHDNQHKTDSQFLTQ